MGRATTYEKPRCVLSTAGFLSPAAPRNGPRVWLCGFVVSGYASVVSLRLTSRTVDIWPVAIRAAIVLLHHQCWPPNTGFVRTVTEVRKPIGQGARRSDFAVRAITGGASKMSRIELVETLSSERDNTVHPLRDEELDAVNGGLGEQSSGYMDDVAGGHTTYKPV